jgi:hypothetical protein
MISEALGLFGLGNPCVTSQSSSLAIYEALGLFGLPNAYVTSDSSSLIIYEALGCLGLRIHVSAVTVVR